MEPALAAVHVVEHVEERLAAPRIEGRVAGRELRPGMERELALSVLSQLGASAGVHPVGMGRHGPMAAADYAKGPLVAGLSLSHSRGLGEYAGVAGGQVTSSVTGLYPWLGYKATERVTVWGVAGYGAGGLRLTPQGGPALEAGLSMAMAAAGTRGELVAGGSGGFALAFKADALWVGTATDGVDGPAGRLAAVTRFRTGLEGSRDYTLAGRLSGTPRSGPAWTWARGSSCWTRRRDWRWTCGCGRW